MLSLEQLQESAERCMTFIAGKKTKITLMEGLLIACVSAKMIGINKLDLQKELVRMFDKSGCDDFVARMKERMNA